MPGRELAFPTGFFRALRERKHDVSATEEWWTSRPRQSGRVYRALTARACVRGVLVVDHGGPSLWKQVMVWLPGSYTRQHAVTLPRFALSVYMLSCGFYFAGGRMPKMWPA